MIETTIERLTPRTRRRYSLSLDEVAALTDQGNLIPIYREIMADMETPVSAYLKIANGPYSFLLESVEGGEQLARYSFLGSDPYLTVRLEDGVAYGNQRGYKQANPYSDPLVALVGVPRRPGPEIDGVEALFAELGDRSPGLLRLDGEVPGAPQALDEGCSSGDSSCCGDRCDLELAG